MTPNFRRRYLQRAMAVEYDSFRIGEWTLIRSRNLLQRGDSEHVLEPRAVELLAYLAARQGGVVGLDALHGDLWAGRVVTDGSIYRLIAELRRVLGDSARAPRYIETVRKRGYRLLVEAVPLEAPTAPTAASAAADAPALPAGTPATATDEPPAPTETAAAVADTRGTPAETAAAGTTAGSSAVPPTPVDADAAAAAPDDSPATPTPHRRPPGLAAALAVVALALLAGLLTLGWRLAGPGPTGPATAVTTAAPEKLAVLPLERLSPSTPPYLAAGLTHTISDRLAAIPELTVIAYPSVRAVAAEAAAPDEVAAALGADLLLSGSVLAAGSGGESGVRLSLSLISPQDGVTRWSRSFDAPLTDVMTLHDQLAADVARALDLELAAAQRGARRREAAVDGAAIDAWLQGTAALQAGFQANNLTEAIAHFEAALERAPDFVPALTGRAVASLRMYSNYHDRSEFRLDLARADVDRAVTLAPDSADARYASGYLASLTGNLERAESELRRALQRQPSHAPALMALGRSAAKRGQPGVASAQLQAAVDVDPLNAIYRYELGLQQLYYGRFAEADENLARAISRAPGMIEAHLYRAWLQVSWLGDTRAANIRLRELRDAVGEDALLRTLMNAGLWGLFTWTEADFDLALAAWSPRESGGDPASWHLAMAEVAFKNGDTAGAREAWSEAALLREADAEASPSSPWLFAELAVALAGLGEREAALRAVGRAMALQPVTEDQWDGTDFLWVRATVLAMLDEREAAIEQISEAVRYPSLTTPNALRVDGHWDGVFEERAFLALVADGGARWRRPRPASGAEGSGEAGRGPAVDADAKGSADRE